MGTSNTGDGRVTGGKTPECGHDIDPDILFEVLRNPTRRMILLYFVRGKKDTADLDELTDHIYSNDPTLPETHATILTELHHIHLPKLADSAVIEYDHDNHSVTYSKSEVLETVLSAIYDM